MKTKPTRLNLGQSMVELALLLPVLLILSVVTLDFGRGIYYYSVVYNAAREGARNGIVSYISNSDGTISLNNGEIDGAARKLAIGLDPSKMDVDPVLINSSKTIQVTVRYSFELVTPLANLILGSDQFNLHSTSRMSMER